MPSVHARTLKRAAEILGGADQLADYLNVRPSVVALWMNGAVTPPDDVFLKAVDVVLPPDNTTSKAA